MFNYKSVNMNVNLRVLSVGALFFMAGLANAQTKKSDTTTTKEIEEVVVLGYNRTSTKPKDISANTVISSETIQDRPNASFLNSIQGAAPGVTINSSSGSPGSGKIDVIIRGVSSINADTEPLIIIDGVPMGAVQFRNLNSEDIESMSILRDAAATSIYGNRGANGVILVKTKGGKFNTPLRISYSGTTGVSILPQNNWGLASATELLTLEKRYNTGLGPTLTDEEIANYPINTDWNKVLFNADLTQQHNVNLTFGGENASVYSSLGYFKMGGLVPNTDFQRMTFRNNITGKSNDKRFTYNAVVGLAYSRRHQLNQETNSGVNNNSIQNPLITAITTPSYLAPSPYSSGQALYNAIKGNYDGGVGAWVLQDAMSDRGVFGRFIEQTTFASANVSYKLADDWTITNRVGVDFKQSDSYAGRHPDSYLAIVVKEGQGWQFGGYEDITNTKEFNFTNVLNLSYNKTIGDHTIGLGAYMEYNKVHYLSNYRRQNGLNPRTFTIGSGRGYVATDLVNDRYTRSVSATKIDAGALSYFASMDYDYASKYGLTATIRRDANYRFIEDNKWGTFWSAGARWNIDREDFMSGSTFSMLKLRASYGTQGNANVVSAGDNTNALLLATNLVRDTSVGVTGYQGLPGWATGTIGNTTLQWEEISQANIGLDFKLANNKLEGTIDVYQKQTDHIYTNILSSAVTGGYGYQGNLGGIRNKGVEATLRYTPINTANARLSIFGNTSYNNNKITDIEIPIETGSLLQVVGGPISQWNVVPYLGVNPSNGHELYLDANGNVTENPQDGDRRATGKNYIPNWVGGFGLNAEYKKFFLDVLFSYQADFYRSDNVGAWIYNPSYMVGGGMVSADLLRAWTPDNKFTDIPALTSPYRSSTSDRFLYDASFVRLRSVMLGYNVPKDFFGEGTVIKGMRVFVQAENLYTWTKWPGYDPESVTTFALSVYPNPRTFSLGVNLDF